VSAPAVSGGRYRLEQPLGHGGMATVYLARDEQLDRAVAVKLLAENLADDATFRKRFLREARLAARLSHPNVVNIYDAGETEDGRPYIVMEHVEGPTLADLMRERGRLSAAEAVGLAVQACRGLAHAHAAGIVHRDVKPQNLLLGPDGTLKVADFGIARAAETTALTQAGTVLGTAAYLSPEQATGEEVGPAADVYSLGAVLYELLTGRLPYEFDSLVDLVEKQARGSITPVSELSPEVPQHVEDAVMRSLARNPAYRPASAEALARELEPEEPPTKVLPSRTVQPDAAVSGSRSPERSLPPRSCSASPSLRRTAAHPRRRVHRRPSRRSHAARTPKSRRATSRPGCGGTPASY
jgi:eukaryotic-like serine/threonine-protein kinase